MKSSSFEKINYILRPKKQIERKVLIELFQRIPRLDRELDVSRYHYIGMGSIFYYDFIMFHKFLHITKMTSIDDKTSEKRFNFNRPYDFVKFHPLSTSDFFEEFNFKEKVIIWLDYDIPLFRIVRDRFIETTILSDLQTITERIGDGCFLIVTVNAKYPFKPGEKLKFMDGFRAYMSPKYAKEARITEENFQFVIQDVMMNFIVEKQKFQDIKFYKLFGFNYSDGAPMFTLGGIYGKSDRAQKLLSTVQYVRTDEDIVAIDVPILTYREKMYLDSKISELTKKESSSSDNSDFLETLNQLDIELESPQSVRGYIEFYKYYPQYYEGLI